MNHDSWLLEKPAFLPRTLAQLAWQNFKKELPDSHAAVLNPQSSYYSHILQHLNFGNIIGAQVSFWISHDSGSLPAFPKSMVQIDCHSFNIEHLDGLAVSMLCCNTMMTLKQLCYPMLKMCHSSKFLRSI